MSDTFLSEIVVFPCSSPLSPNLKPEIEGYLAGKGVTVRYLLDPYEHYGSKQFLFSAASVDDRMRVLSEEFTRKPDGEGRSCMLAARGGAGALELLESLKSVSATSRKVVLSGFSDVTPLLYSLPAQDSLVTGLHGPSLLSFRDEVAAEVKDENWRHLCSVVAGGAELLTSDELELYRGPSEGVTGELVGGNLSLICSVLGTPYLPEFSGKILILEDVGMSPHQVYRLLLQLQLAGVFREVAGVVLGEFLNCKHAKGLGPSLEEIFSVLFDNSSVPVYRSESFGHGKMIRSFPLGKAATLSGEGLQLTSPEALL